jgi:hypothetical protein
METKRTVEQSLARYVPTNIRSDNNHLSENQKKAVDLLVKAAKCMDEIYIEQKWAGNKKMYDDLKKDTTENGKKLARYFWINRCPWSILDEHETFVPSAPDHPKGGNFYPEDMTKEEFEKFVAGLSDHEAKDAKGFFHLIRRDSNGSLKLVPYSEAYKETLQRAADLLRQAGDLCENDSLKLFLTSRADAFLSNSYSDSDINWLQIDSKSPIDVTIGPYEVYQDELFNYKATFEAFIALRDIKETQKLSKFESELQNIEDNLPLETKYKNPKLGTESPIVVVNEIFAGGDVGGPKTSAFNLPNDEHVVENYGCKKVMLKNIQEAKFEKILKPISDVLIAADQRQYINFDAFFTHILAHELVHGIGPHNIVINGTATTVRTQLQEAHSAIEEAKADIAGLFALAYLMDNGVVEKSMEKSFYVTFLAGAFRSIRFGLAEAHGKGQALQLTYLLKHNAFHHDKATETFSVNFDKVRKAVTDLTAIILTLQGEGSKTKAQELLDHYGINLPEVQHALEKLTAAKIPVDIDAIYDWE